MLQTQTWKELLTMHGAAQPSRGPGLETTFNSQATFVLPFEYEDGTVLYIYMGDRWNEGGPGSVRPPTLTQVTLLAMACSWLQWISKIQSWQHQQQPISAKMVTDQALCSLTQPT